MLQEWGIYTYQIFDSQGSLLITKHGSQRIDLGSFVQGVYLVKVQGELGEVFTLKLLKAN